jgi:hypothetical protein
MPHDIADHIYRYLARDWHLANDVLTSTKCHQLSRWITNLRGRYKGERDIPYQQVGIRRAYLPAFGPRYAYILYRLFEEIEQHHGNPFAGWPDDEVVICLVGGGPAIEVFGLLDRMYQNNFYPKYLHVVIVDRQRYWRSFHSYLFSELFASFFRRTQIIPTYEEIDVPVPSGVRFDPSSISYGYGQVGLLSKTRILSVVNCFSEIADHRAVQQHLRYLLRLPCNDVLFVCADSNAKKRRPRMSWLDDFFTSGKLISHSRFSGRLDVNCHWLHGDATTNLVFPGTPGSPSWLTNCVRWAYARLIEGNQNV